MSKNNLFITIIFSLSVALVISVWTGVNINSERLVSPQLLSSKTIGLNQWFPKSVLGANSAMPYVTANSAIFLETRSGRVLYSKNEKNRLPIASLVKVMTAVVALEHKNLEDKFLVSQRAADIEPDKMLLIAGETLTLKELLYGVFLVSANDAAEVIAENTLIDEEFTFDQKGSSVARQRFISLMNAKAKQLGMLDTYFANPTGLDADENNSYSTAYDLSLLTRYAVRNYPFLIDITKTEHIILPITQKHQDYDMYSGINLLSTYPGVMGFKTGYTPQAGLTLITLARIDNLEVIGVLLNSAYRRDEAKELLDYSFSQL